jgi:pentatricopeptide repeat protein
MSIEIEQNADFMPQSTSYVMYYLKPFVADIGVLIVFGLCYLVWKYINSETKKTTETAKSTKQPEGKTIVDKWAGARSIQRFNSLIQNNKDKNTDAFKILAAIQKAEINPDIHTYNCLIDMSFSLEQAVQARKLFEEISDFTSPVQPDAITFNILLKGMVDEIKVNKDQKDFLKNVEILEEISKLEAEMKRRNIIANLITFNTLIDSCVELGKNEEAWRYYKDMQNKDIIPDVYTYSTLIKGLKVVSSESATEENLERALEILKKIKNGECGEGVKVDDILYNSVIDICVKFNKIEQAEVIFNEMKEMNLKPSLVTYSILIKGYGNCNKLQSAIALYTQLREHGLRPNDILYGNLLNTAAKCNRLDIMTEIFQTMINEDVKPNHVIYSQIIKAHSKSKNYVKAFEIFESVPNKVKEEANIILYNIILDAYAESGEFEKLFQLYEYIKRKCDEIETFPRPNVITYSTIIKGYAKCGKLEEAKNLYKYLKENAYNLDEVLFNTVCDAFAKANEVDMALSVLMDMKKLNIKRDSIIYAILIKMYCNQMNEEKCMQVFDEMQKDNLRPNLVVYTTLMQMFLKKKKIPQAIAIFNDIKISKIIPDAVTYNFIINGCTFNQKLEKGIEFLLEALKNKTRLSLETYKNVLEYLLNNKFMKVNDRIIHAQEILKELKENNIKINDDLYNRVARLIYQRTNVEQKQTTQTFSFPMNNYMNNNTNMSNLNNTNQVNNQFNRNSGQTKTWKKFNNFETKN